MQSIKTVVLKDLSGKEIQDGEGPLTSTKGFVMILGQAMAVDPDNAIAMYALGQKILASTDDVLFLEDAEFKVLNQAVRANARGLFAVVWAQLLQLVDLAENA